MQQRLLKQLHFFGTALFLLSAFYIFVLSLLQAGAKWWLIFTLSGPSAIVALFLVSVYLFAIFRGATRGEYEIEHPLTGSSYYMVFYDLSPLLGCFGGVVGFNFDGEWLYKDFFLNVSYGILLATFLVWILVDPFVSLLENAMPQSRRHRALRISKAKLLRENKQKERQVLLEKVQEDAKREQQRWDEVLEPQAQALVQLFDSGNSDEQAEKSVVDIGLTAWKMGGLNCMEHLYSIVCQKLGKDGVGKKNYISLWWDGIGNWRYDPFAV